uniref:Uncharacterized protein n=1 Tax=Panagrolaimus sp. PS1159 TaxID=55785 RepID=A0AC35GPH6_9BILA
MSMYLCRRVCCCCYSEKKNANPVTLTRAETITVQPTTSAALEMHQVTTEEIRHEQNNKKVAEDKLSIASELDEIDLNEQIPTDEDLQPAPIPSAVDQTFAAAVTDMMLDEINDNASEKGEIIEEPVKIDNNVIAEATEEEVRRTLTRTKVEKRTPIVEKLNFQELSTATGHEVYKEKKAVIAEKMSLPSPEKPPRQQIVSTIPEKDIEDEIEEEREVRNLVKVKEDLAEKKIDKSDDPSIQSLGTIESDIGSHTPEISHLESEATEAQKIVPLIRANEINQKLENESEEEEEDSVRTATTATSDNEFSSSVQKISHGNIKDENAEVEIFENREVIIHDNHTIPKHRGHLETSKPPESYPRTTTSMYGNISDSDESETSESEAESVDVPRKKPNRVSVKQTNVVLTKVTAVDAPPSETSETESFSSPRNRNHQHDNNYVVLTDEEFSEKVI